MFEGAVVLLSLAEAVPLMALLTMILGYTVQSFVAREDGGSYALNKWSPSIRRIQLISGPRVGSCKRCLLVSFRICDDKCSKNRWLCHVAQVAPSCLIAPGLAPLSIR